MIHVPSLLAVRGIEVGVMSRRINPVLGTEHGLRVLLPRTGRHRVPVDQFQESKLVFSSRASYELGIEGKKVQDGGSEKGYGISMRRQTNVTSYEAYRPQSSSRRFGRHDIAGKHPR
jgi:hypothetical protein